LSVEADQDTCTTDGDLAKACTLDGTLGDVLSGVLAVAAGEDCAELFGTAS
jgi:hypothetical protein